MILRQRIAYYFTELILLGMSLLTFLVTLASKHYLFSFVLCFVIPFIVYMTRTKTTPEEDVERLMVLIKAENLNPHYREKEDRCQGSNVNVNMK